MSEEKRIEGLGELKNGLEAMVNLLYLIREDRKYPDKVFQWVEMADVQTHRMAQVLNGMSQQKLTPQNLSANDSIGVARRYNVGRFDVPPHRG